MVTTVFLSSVSLSVFQFFFPNHGQVGPPSGVGSPGNTPAIWGRLVSCWETFVYLWVTGIAVLPAFLNQSVLDPVVVLSVQCADGWYSSSDVYE